MVVGVEEEVEALGDVVVVDLEVGVVVEAEALGGVVAVVDLIDLGMSEKHTIIVKYDKTDVFIFPFPPFSRTCTHNLSPSLFLSLSPSLLPSLLRQDRSRGRDRPY